MTTLPRLTRAGLLRGAVIALVAALAIPIGAVSARVFPRVREAIQLSALPLPSGASLQLDTCAVIQFNQPPRYCERMLTLPAPTLAAVTEYPDHVAQSGWEVIYRRTGRGFDTGTGRPIRIDCYVYRSRVWGARETLALVIINFQWVRARIGAARQYCVDNGQIG